MIYTHNIVFIKYQMADKKIYTQVDLNICSSEHIKIIDEEFKRLNKDKNITHPSEKEYKIISQQILKMLADKTRCRGIYLKGKYKNQRCQASPHPGSNYCLNHKNQDPNNKELLETDPKILLELLRKSKLNDQ